MAIFINKPNGVLTAFIECTSLNVTYDIMGIATVNYTIVYETDGDIEPPLIYEVPITFGTITFDGYVNNMNLNQIPDTQNWYECQVTLTTTAVSAV